MSPLNPAAADAPETPAQAAAWQRVKAQALTYGLCHRCAAQFAWGTQLGFARVEHPPCETCAPLVEALPRPRLNGWRGPHGDSKLIATWPAPYRAHPTEPRGGRERAAADEFDHERGAL